MAYVTSWAHLSFSVKLSSRQIQNAMSACRESLDSFIFLPIEDFPIEDKHTNSTFKLLKYWNFDEKQVPILTDMRSDRGGQSGPAVNCPPKSRNPPLSDPCQLAQTIFQRYLFYDIL